jgi:hypothetical protein
VKKYFYIGLFLLFLTEVVKAYLLMPMPGSQEQNLLPLVYFLYNKRWLLRIIFGLMIIAGFKDVFAKRKWIPVSFLLIAIAGIYFADVMMAADKMFKETGPLVLKGKAENKVDENSLVLCVQNGNEVRAYPVQFIYYHHKVYDTIAGQPVIATYCSVCRTGMVYVPEIKNKPVKFRLVGMQHYNAMFEDEETKSWWAQESGECIAGPLKGELLKVFPSRQMTLEKAFEFYPSLLVMQADEKYLNGYDSDLAFENGKIKTGIERTDSVSWKDKSWVIGITIDTVSKAYDWIELKKNKIVQDKLGNKSFFIMIADNQKDYIVAETRGFVQPEIKSSNDTIFIKTEGKEEKYNFAGKSYSRNVPDLHIIPSRQEFLHSWENFHPHSLRYHQQ